ncbi:hypothetical protein [Leptospira noguchii]|uniref:hypothetical protein n=1 Tax=Leptospira noguchii TaxID=28182 RepID=UPI001FB5B556|nr:hypothetical protein [Leptospira noguchii]UOG54053.1 hypothetical protein MAL09_08175 [Leptospira noguchii]
MLSFPPRPIGSHNQPHKLNRILESKLNSVKRSLNSASHSPNSAKRFLRKRFRSFDRSCSIIKLKLKIKYCITFLSCNLLT